MIYVALLCKTSLFPRRCTNKRFKAIYQTRFFNTNNSFLHVLPLESGKSSRLWHVHVPVFKMVFTQDLLKRENYKISGAVIYITSNWRIKAKHENPMKCSENCGLGIQVLFMPCPWGNYRLSEVSNFMCVKMTPCKRYFSEKLSLSADFFLA